MSTSNDKPPVWATKLLDWFDSAQREMPWRATPSPYRTWVSEIMLQQTQVDTVIPYFNRFIETFPTPDTLAQADEQEVLKKWEGLGYYSRARNLQKAAKLVVSDYKGILPDTYEELQKLPGIGPYCAAAITSIAFDNPVPVVDGNVLRVFTRFWGIPDDIRQPKVRNQLFDKLTPIIQHTPPADFNQAIMELGALICKPKNPECTSCPISKECYANKHNKTNEFPFKSKKAPIPHYTIGVGIIYKNNQILIAKRKTDQMLGGLWEFPGGKQKEKEKITDTVLREIKEETNLNVTIQEELVKVNHTFSHFKITLHAYTCNYKSGIAAPNTSDAIKWINLEEIDDYPFPTANKKIISKLKQHTAKQK